MPIDLKYGRIQAERGTIGADEPVVLFRAQDAQLCPTLEAYRALCVEAGSPPHHIDAIDRATEAVAEWQRHNHTQVPQSAMLAPEETPSPNPDKNDS
jgi:hypothetical protein